MAPAVEIVPLVEVEVMWDFPYPSLAISFSPTRGELSGQSRSAKLVQVPKPPVFLRVLAQTCYLGGPPTHSPCFSRVYR